MKIREYEQYNSIVLEIKDKLEGGPDASQLQDLVQKHISAGRKNFIADLGKVKYVNSTGLGILIRAYTTSTSADGNLKLANINQKMRGLLSITKLNKVFEVYETVEEAAKSYK